MNATRAVVPPRTPPTAIRQGPWALRAWGTRSWVTAACTRCGAVLWDEALGMTASFPSVEDARRELPGQWGWQVTSPPGESEQVLCPGCAARHRAGAAGTGHARTRDGG